MPRPVLPSPLTILLAFLFAAGLPAQDQKLPPRPADVAATLAQKPVTPPAAEGARIEIVDRAKDQPLADADVFVVDQAPLEALRKPLQEVQRSFAQDRDGYPRLLAAWYGVRYRTGADGTVLVPRLAKCLLVVIAGERFGSRAVRQWPDDGITIKLIERVYFEVAVVDAKGKPAAEVPVAFGSLWEHGDDHQFFHGSQVVTTDGSGRARLPAEQVHGEDNLAVQAQVLAGKPIRAKLVLDKDRKLAAPVVLTLPPCGMVRVLLYDENEHPLAGLRDVSLGTAEMAGQGVVGKPSKLTKDAAFFRWVGLDQQLQVSASVEGLEGQLRHDQAGPTRVGEMVVCGVRLTATDPIVRLRPLGLDGQPLGKAALGFVRATDKSFELSEVATDADGRLQFTVPREWLQEEGERKVLLLARTAGTEVSGYRGALQVPLTAASQGIVDLGEIKLVEEPVLVAGVLVDGDGEPLSGFTVQAALSHASQTQSSSTSSSGDYLFSGHKVRTDDQGRFTLRELAPKDVPIELSIDGGDWVLSEKATATPGTGELRLQAVRAGSLVLTLAKGEGRDNLGFYLQPAAEGASSLHAWVRNGKAEWRGLVPGRYQLTVSTVGDNVELLKDLEVKAGEACADPRLRELALGGQVMFVTVQLHRPDGKPASNVPVNGVSLRRGGGSCSHSRSNKDGTVNFTFGKQGNKIMVCHADWRTVIVDDPKSDCRIDLVARAQVRLLLADGVKLPDGLLVRVEPTSKDWWMQDDVKAETTWQDGKDVLVHPDREGELRIELFDRERASLWQGRITVPAGDRVDVTVPIDQETAAAILKEHGGK